MIDAKPDAPWCPTNVDDEGYSIVGKWGICGPECPNPPGKKFCINYLPNILLSLLLCISSFFTEKKCTTVAGPDVNVQCIFPFVYRGILYKTCSAIDANPDAPWCPTKVDDEGHAIVGKGKWGICEPKCPMPHGKILVLNFL